MNEMRKTAGSKGRARLRRAAAALLLTSLCRTGAAAAMPDPPSWTENVAPFKIADDLYYVGSREIGIYLIDGGEGLILIDGGVAAFAPQLLANIRALGFDPRRIRILLNSQAHSDHAGALAAVKKASGAKLLASRKDAPLLESGGRGDFYFGDKLLFPAVKVDGLVRDGGKVKLGRAELTAHLTPGHTKGCTTRTMKVKSGGRTHDAQFNCSATVPGYTLLGNAAYPNMVSDYELTFAKLRRLPCDLFLASHGSFFDFDRKRAALAGGARANPFVDPAGCRSYIGVMEGRFRAQLARERAAATGAVLVE